MADPKKKPPQIGRSTKRKEEPPRVAADPELIVDYKAPSAEAMALCCGRGCQRCERIQAALDAAEERGRQEANARRSR